MSTENSDRLQKEETERALQAKSKLIHCGVPHCGMPAVSSLIVVVANQDSATNCESSERRQFCLAHFIVYCYDRLQHCSPSNFPDPDSTDAEREAEGCFLDECTDQAAELVCPLRGFDNLDRARLFDIFLWASELRANRAVLYPRPAEDSRRAHGAPGT